MEDEKKTISTEETEKNTDTKESQSNLDALLFDADDGDSRDSGKDDIQFEAFMAEYRTLISKNLSEASEAKKAKGEPKTEESEADESEFLISLPKKQSKKNKSEKQKNSGDENEVWDEEITLKPEEYTDLAPAEETMHEQLPDEEEFVPDFDLGEKVEEKGDKFQFSINFEGETPKESADEEEKKPKYDPDKPRIVDWVFDIAEMFVFVLVAVMILTTLLFRHSVVEGDSMNNTLHDGDHLIISNLFYTPQRGDIIVFEDYSTSLKKAVVKRVIGLPNETVEVKVNGYGEVEVYIDGVLLEEDYAYNANDCDIAIYHNPVTLGENEIFVMGDNRYHSADSRDPNVGPIEIDSILGKILFRFYPLDSFGAVD